jgi:hypothetical protein
MVAYNFQTLASKIDRKGLEESSKWFRDQVAKVSSVNVKKLMEPKNAGPFKLLNNLSPASVGKMYMFFYDPKHKETLPYYDTFPLVIPIEFYNDGFLGINFHYLPPVLRAKLLDALYDTLNNDKYDKTTKLKINYQILAASARYRWFKPCVKRYLFNHVQSRFQYVAPTDWEKALMLPTERFVGSRKRDVFENSKGMI